MDLLHEFQCDTLPSTTYPLGPLSKTYLIEHTLAVATSYRKLVGKLKYRKNISLFLQALTKFHMTAALHTLRYIQKDPSQDYFSTTSQITIYRLIVIQTGLIVHVSKGLSVVSFSC